MSQLNPLLENPILIIASVFVFIYAIKELDGLVKWIKSKLNDYKDEENENDDLKVTVKNISCVSEKHTETLKELTDAIKEINFSVVKLNQAMDQRFNEAGEQRKQDQVVTDRATLYQLYSEFQNQDSLTIAQFEVFHNVAERYMGNGGNGAFRKLIPKIESKFMAEDKEE